MIDKEYHRPAAQLLPSSSSLDFAMLYRNLPSSTSTRLMRLLPGSENEPLVCLLDVVDVDLEDVRYTSISYTWGDPKQKNPLRCNNETLMIPASLFSALHRQRDNENRQTFWVDAVCISQAEDKDALQERAQQIQMMDKIFSGAEIMLIDLREQPEAYCAYLACASVLLDFGVDNINMQIFSNGDMPEELANLRLDSPVWDAYNDISSRPWYRRVWIVQEYVLVKEMKILIGNVALDFELFCAFTPLFDWLLIHLRAMRIRTLEIVSRASKVDVDLQTRSRQAKYFMQDCRKIHEQSTKVPLRILSEPPSSWTRQIRGIVSSEGIASLTAPLCRGYPLIPSFPPRPCHKDCRLCFCKTERNNYFSNSASA